MKPGHALLALALAAAPAPARAQTIDRSNGEAGAPSRQRTTTPRAAALGGALTAASGVTSIFANPAGVVTVQHFEAQLAGQTLFEGSKAGSMALGVRRHAVGLALGIRYLDLGSVDEVVCNGCGGRRRRAPPPRTRPRAGAPPPGGRLRRGPRGAGAAGRRHRGRTRRPRDPAARRRPARLSVARRRRLRPAAPDARPGPALPPGVARLCVSGFGGPEQPAPPRPDLHGTLSQAYFVP